MTLATARDLSIILLSLEALVITLILGAVLFLTTRGLSQGIRWLRTIGFPEVQRYGRLVSDQTKFYSAKVTAPIVAVETTVHQARGSVSAIPRFLRRRRYKEMP